MAMSNLLLLLCCLLLSVHYSVSENSPPALAPEEFTPPPNPHSIPSPAPISGSPENPPVGSPLSYSPSPSPSPSDLKSFTPSPAPAPTETGDSAPAPSLTASDLNHSDMNSDKGEESSDDGGMSGGKKAGIAVGVVAAVCLVGFGGLVYKKRQDNIRRSEYGYAARREIL
ncbi:hypothetical protein EZV62_002436 [Acer yangbiense]|uniref:Uncharacterized protein n=1 Tax=Acer yangbiense TaxID=1000413 RepID=A0A5C7IX57_9ROSI|nr:hypothetical protein EZV62_002436 [Acer yangbiense]